MLAMQLTSNIKRCKIPKSVNTSDGWNFQFFLCRFILFKNLFFQMPVYRRRIIYHICRNYLSFHNFYSSLCLLVCNNDTKQYRWSESIGDCLYKYLSCSFIIMTMYYEICHIIRYEVAWSVIGFTKLSMTHHTARHIALNMAHHAHICS